MPPDDRLGLFTIDAAARALPEHDLPEPAFATARLDPERAILEPDTPLPRARRERWRSGALLLSLALHLLLPLALLVGWLDRPVPEAAPIPVQLVLQPPPPEKAPPPPAPPPVEKKPPPGRIASEEMAPPEKQPDNQPAHAETSPAEPPAEMQVVTAPPPPALVSPPEALAPHTAPAPALPEPKPLPAKPPVKRSVVARLAPSAPPHAGPVRIPGPSANRDEYLAYCMSLIRRHYDMLPASLIAGRRGLTTLTVTVLDDGTIARIRISRSSGYSDIDSRIEQMLAAVGRFPPLPQWIQGPSIMLYYDQSFPEGLQQH